MRKKRGQTLIVILIALAVGGMLMVGVLSILTSFYRTRHRFNKLNQLVTTGNHIFTDINQEVHWSLNAAVTGNELTLEQEKNGVPVTVTYSLDGPTLKKNSTDPLSPEDIIITDFEVQNRAGACCPPLIQIHLGLEHIDPKPKISLEKDTTISLRKLQFPSP